MNQNPLEAEEEEGAEPKSTVVERTSATPMSDVLTRATPPLVQSPASSISSAAPIAPSDLEEEEGAEPKSMVVERTSATPTSDVLTRATPPLVQSPASSISSAAYITSSYSDDGERTIQVTDISEPLPQKFTGDLDAWFDCVAPAPDVVVCGVYNVKVFEYVEPANPYHKYVIMLDSFRFSPLLS